MKEVTIESQDDVHLLAKRLDFHVFRGQKQDWKVKSKLARVLDSSGIEHGNFRNRENNVIREFASRVSLYEKIEIAADDKIGCCSLMQHYGAPTRLIDFTRSFYVALFFAVEDIEQRGDSIIWCLNENRIRDAAIDRDQVSAPDGNIRQVQYERMWSVANEFLGIESVGRSTLLILNPPQKNERISRQQGCFLCPSQIDTDIIAHAVKTFSLSSNCEQCSVGSFNKLNHEEAALKVKIPSTIRREILGLLWKMNINHEILFPGIDGFCKSMYYHCTLLP